MERGRRGAILVWAGLVLGFAAGSGPADWRRASIDVLQVKDMEIADVLDLLAGKSGANIVAGADVSGRVTVFLKDVPMEEALRAVLDARGLAYREEGRIVRVMTEADYRARYGEPFGRRTVSRVVRPRHTRADDLAQVLERMKGPDGRIIVDAKSNTLVMTGTPARIAALAGLAERLDVPLETRTFRLSYASPKDLAETIGKELTPSVGRLRFDEGTGTLSVTDTPLVVGEVARMVEAFDEPRPQVLIEARIVQILLSDRQRLGVDWRALVRNYHRLDLSGSFDILDTGARGGRLGVGTLDEDDYQALMEALKSTENTRILSNPRVLALNRREAKILVGTTEPYVTATVTTPASGPTVTAEQVRFVEVGVKLYVTPVVHRDGFITLTLRPEVSSVTRTVTTATRNVIPVVGSSEAETTVTVKDGVTVVIGGMIKEETVRTEHKIPFLGDVPWLGGLFRSRDDLKRKSEILLFLTPRIVSGDVDSSEAETARKE